MVRGRLNDSFLSRGIGFQIGIQNLLSRNSYLYRKQHMIVVGLTDYGEQYNRVKGMKV